MVELALIFPFLLLLGISVIDYGHYLETTNNLITVDRDGARYASLNPDNLTTACPDGPQSADASCPAGYDTIQGLMQAEANSLTLPAGGINLENADCSWSGSNLGSPNPYSSCISVAFCSTIPSPTGPCTPGASTYVGRWSDATCSGEVLLAAGTCATVSASGVAAGALVTIWVAYGYQPLTPIYNSIFGLQLIKIDYSVILEKAP